MRIVNVFLILSLVYPTLLSTTEAASEEFSITIEQLLSATTGQEFVDATHKKWRLDGAHSLLAGLNRKIPKSLLRSPVLQLHATPIILSTDTTGPGMFFSQLTQQTDEGDYAQVGLKFHVPTIFLSAGIDPCMAEFYLIRRIPLADLSSYPVIPNTQEIESRYREALITIHPFPEERKVPVPFNKEEARKFLYAGAVLGISVLLLTAHFLRILLRII